MSHAVVKLGAFKQYDSQVLELTVFDADGSPRDITNDRILFRVAVFNLVKDSLNGATEVNKVTPLSGRADIIIDPGDLAKVPGVHDYEVVGISGVDRTTLVDGTITVEKSVITETSVS